MEINEIIINVVAGNYSDWFFDVFMAQVVKAIRNNFELLVICSYLFAKFTDMTSNKWDDSWSNSFDNFLNRFKPSKKKDTQ